LKSTPLRLAWVALAAAAALCIWPPSGFALAFAPLLTMPWIVFAMALIFPARVVLFPDAQADDRLRVAVFAIAPAVVLAYRAARDPLPMEWSRMLPLVFAGAAVMTAVAAISGRAARRRDKRVIGVAGALFAAFSVYCGASALLLNRALDRDEPELNRSLVASKNIELDAFRRVTSRQMTFEMPWFSWARATLPVDAVVYDGLNVHEFACVRIHPGFLHLAWMDVQLCPSEPVADAADGPAEDSSPRVRQLDSGSYAELDRYFNDVQQRYERGQASEKELHDAFLEVREASDHFDRRYDEWIAAYPRSYAAHLLRGSHSFHVGRAARGETWFSEVPAPKIERMERYFRLARQDLHDSLDLTSRPYLSALYLLNVAMIDGDQSERRQWMELGNRLEPKNFFVRRRYMNSLEPRWGGSFPAMEEFLEQSRAAGLTPDKIAELEGMIEEDRAHERYESGDLAGAAQKWGRVLDLYRNAGLAPPFDAQNGYVGALLDQKRVEEAVPEMERLSAAYPDLVWAHTQLAAYYNGKQRFDESWTHLQQGARLHDPWSEAAVGRTLYYGAPKLHIAPDKEAGLVWIRKAAAQGDHDAAQFLRTH
jgi:tetratricopeptide (TPR) repeat protein